MPVPLESNPEVMNRFLAKVGVPSNVHVVDVYSLETEMLGVIPQPTLALILLYPDDENCTQHKLNLQKEIEQKGQEVSGNVYFAKQLVDNLCGTMALIHSLANADSIQLRDGYLKDFLDESRFMSPDERGQLLQKAEGIINAHKEVAKDGQTAPPDENDPVPFHFITFVHKDGSLYELDGSKEFPINHGACNEESFLQNAADVCQQYMSRNPDNVNFTVVALVNSET